VAFFVLERDIASGLRSQYIALLNQLLGKSGFSGAGKPSPVDEKPAADRPRGGSRLFDLRKLRDKKPG
jgi:hypothetical protein